MDFFMNEKNIEKNFLIVKENEEKLKEINKNLEIKLNEKVSELKEKEKQLQNVIKSERESKNKFKKMMDSFVDLYFETDTNGIITFVTPSCYDFGGYTQEDLIGKKVMDLYQNPKERMQLLKTLKEEGEIKNFFFNILDKNGNGIITSLNAKNIIDENGNTNWYIRDT